MKKILLAVVASSLLSGCISSSALEKKVAFKLGEEPSAVKVTNVSHGLFDTSFNASVRGRKHNCTVLFGNIFTFGFAIFPQCTPLKRR